MKDNLSSEDSGYSEDKQAYNGTRDDWMGRAWGAEAKLDKIKEILKWAPLK